MKPLKALGLDTGNKKTGWCIIDSQSKKVYEHGDTDNQILIDSLPELDFDWVAGEMLEARGKVVADNTFESILWLGRLIEAAGKPFTLAYPRHIRAFHCGRPNSKDAEVKNALKTRYRNCVKEYKEKNIKEFKDCVLLVGSDEWAAYAVATYISEKYLS